MTVDRSARRLCKSATGMAINERVSSRKSTARSSVERLRRHREAFPSRNLRQLLRDGLLRFFLGLPAPDGGPR